ncbi:MAG: DUF1573 domain-containing protein [Bacteroidales bacterium]|nr:DUF1573 domain-containing protein [Bacteroidales bacterium]MBQ8223030.1 DUF1573 domain-containing protein [Bacteroidales bacterium]
MKNLLAVFCSLFLMLSFAEAQTVSENGPEITFEKTSHQFGEIPFNGNGTYEFVFKNTGNEPLILSQPKSSCGCTVPEWPKKPILPGDTDVIKVTYKNTNRPGSFSKYVTIYSNAKTNKDVKLYIRGKILPEQTEALPMKDNSMNASPVNNSSF